MQTTFPTHYRRQTFIEKTCNKIPAFVIVVNAAGPIKEGDLYDK